MLIRPTKPVPENEVTDARLWLGRRQVIAAAATGLLAASLPAAATPSGSAPGLGALSFTPGKLPAGETLTSRDKITSYNNFYEFGTDKSDPAENAGALKVLPWTVTVEGECHKPGQFAIEDLIKPGSLQERIYRHRCVEGWSMVIPWIGLPLASLLGRVEPTGNAKYVAFETLLRPSEMTGQNSHVLDWPYREGLRLDEAMNDLTLLAVGLYGDVLPNQNGTPIRLVVPWKYGFKGAKSIVRIRLQEQMPQTSWNMYAPGEYGFYSNVNPDVDHPRWSQRKERRVGEVFRRETLKFNGYGEQVASLYAGMDLKVNY